MADIKETEISLKVVIFREKNKVVFAEAGSDFVDILFSFLTMPMGTIVRLLTNRADPSHPSESIGSYNNLYGSVENLDAMYFETKECQDMLLNTRNSAEDCCRYLKINSDDMKPIQYFVCDDKCIRSVSHRNSLHTSTSSDVKCRYCGRFLDRAVQLESSTSGDNKGVFVTKTSSFVISDDLHVIPNNLASTLGILESCGIKNFADLEEKTLKLGSNEILDLLQCSFLSKTPLSDMFFGKKCISTLPVLTIQSQNGTTCTDDRKMTVKVFVQKSNNKILLAQSSEDFVDFLFSLLTIPLGKVISLVTRDQESPMSVENIHQSVLELNVHEYLKSQELKNMLVDPKLSMHYLCSNHIFPLKEERGSWDITPDGQYKIHANWGFRSREFTTERRKGSGGFVGGPTKFMVTDDLVVTPLSSMACFTYLHRMKMTPSDIEEQVVHIGMEEGLNLLRASLTSTAVLTNGLKFLIMKNATSLKKAQSEKLLKKPKVEN